MSLLPNSVYFLHYYESILILTILIECIDDVAIVIVSIFIFFCHLKVVSTRELQIAYVCYLLIVYYSSSTGRRTNMGQLMLVLY